VTKSSAKQALKLRSQRHANLPTHMTCTTRTPNNTEQLRMRRTASALSPDHCLPMQGSARTAATCSPHRVSWHTSHEASTVSGPLCASRPATSAPLQPACKPTTPPRLLRATDSLRPLPSRVCKAAEWSKHAHAEPHELHGHGHGARCAALRCPERLDLLLADAGPAKTLICSPPKS